MIDTEDWNTDDTDGADEHGLMLLAQHIADNISEVVFLSYSLFFVSYFLFEILIDTEDWKTDDTDWADEHGLMLLAQHVADIISEVVFLSYSLFFVSYFLFEILIDAEDWNADDTDGADDHGLMLLAQHIPDNISEVVILSYSLFLVSYFLFEILIDAEDWKTDDTDGADDHGLMLRQQHVPDKVLPNNKARLYL